MRKLKKSKKVFVGLSPVGKRTLPTGHAGSRKKVFVGLSGGVDSSVTAALLKRAGYDVTGVFIKVWQPPFLDCSSREDRLDAMRVAAHLGIPFETLDLEKEYKKGVVDYMLREYRKGSTPNPDAMCNAEVKFGAFLSWAKKKGADFVATGHYARSARNSKKKTYELKKGTDNEKDQSYFLWMLDRKELPSVLFPVGGYRKREVRALARKFGLPTAEKKDSQGLCFVGKVDMKEFLAHFIRRKKGVVENEEGTPVGTHDGAEFYTLGERHGFAINKKNPDDKPYYVIGKRMKDNVVIVSMEPKRHGTQSRLIRATRPNFISELKIGGRYQARFRYRGALMPASVEKIGGRGFTVRLGKGDFTVSPGQSLVLYDGDKCLGGGIIA